MVSAASNSLMFAAPKHVGEPHGAYGSFTYAATDGELLSAPGIVWLVPPHKRLAHSDFWSGSEGWRIVENGAVQRGLPGGGVAHEAYADGLLDRYITGTDADTSGVLGGGHADPTQWYFQAPAPFLGRHTIAFGGHITFSVSVPEGLLTTDNFREVTHGEVAATPLVLLSCATCTANSGITLGYFLAPAASEEQEVENSLLHLAEGPTSFRVPLRPSAWFQRPKSSLLEWHPVTECDFVEVLSGITELRILGDLTLGRESVSIDDVAIVAGEGQVSLACAHKYY